MIRNLLRKVILFISSLNKGKNAGKIIGFLDFCRDTICHNEKTYAGQIHKRMDPYNIIPNKDNIKIKNNIIIKPTDKIKVRIIYPTGDSWNNIHTLYEEFKNDERFQTVILVKGMDCFVKILEDAECDYVIYDNYDLKNDRPDILIATFYSSYDKEIIFPSCHDYIGKVYALIPNAIMNEENKEIHWQYVNRAYTPLSPDRFLVDPLVYNALSDYIPDELLIKAGGCQFDEIYEEVGRDHPKPTKWEKLNGKKIFLWATDHGINESYPKNGFTVDLYMGDMLKYFSEHLDFGLILRPHPQFIREMMEGGHFWTYDELQKIKAYIDKTPNVIWDDTHDYCCAYDTCDALIVDANCSITCSFLTTGKPICRLLRYDIREWLVSPELYDCYYYAQNFNECINFMNMIAKGEDPKEPVRKNGMEKAILHFDGMNGKRMKEFITNDYYKSTLRRVNIMN